MLRTTRRQFLASGAAAGALAYPRIGFAAGGTIKVGVIAAITGAQAPFGVAETYMLEKVMRDTGGVLKSGGTEYDVEFILRDTQSNPNRLASVGQELILRDGVDLLLIQDGNAAIAVGELAERFGVPTISTMTPWQAWMFPRNSTPDRGFKWTYHFFWGADDAMSTFVSIWDTLDTDRIAGDFYLDNSTGNAFSDPRTGLPAFMGQGGYARVDGGRFAVEAEDFTSQVSLFKEAGADIITGFGFPAHWATFWNQAGQADLRPAACTFAGAFLFPDAINVLGERGDGMTTEVWWTPQVPFTSSLTGEDAAKIAQDWEDSTGSQWVQLLGYSQAMYEVALDVLGRSGAPKDKAAVRDALAATVLDTIVGRVDFANSPIKSTAVTQLAGGQWRKSSGPHQFDLLITANAFAPDIPPVAETVSLRDL